MADADPRALLEVRGLTIRFGDGPGLPNAVDGIGFSVGRGETIGIVGESGSGKSQTLFAILGLLPASARLGGSIRLEGQELVGAPAQRMRQLRGMQMAMVFQDPMTALNPYLTIERQLTEVLIHHQGSSRRDARDRALKALHRVRIPDAERLMKRYPHQLSGGMRQRVVIAMAMLGSPALLLADEPTTALDVTIQAQILDLLAEQQRLTGTSIILVTHDLGIVARLCDRVLVMYAGRIVEQAEATMLFATPRHPYTQMLLRTIPRLDRDEIGVSAADVKSGRTLSSGDPALGCAFAPRCSQVFATCWTERPPLYPTLAGSATACHLAAPVTAGTTVGPAR